MVRSAFETYEQYLFDEIIDQGYVITTCQAINHFMTLEQFNCWLYDNKLSVRYNGIYHIYQIFQDHTLLDKALNKEINPS